MDQSDWQPPTSGSNPELTVPVGPTDTIGTERRRPAVVIGAVAGVVALGLAGIFAVQRLGGAAAGGAATADELGSSLLAAIEAEDVLGVIDTMLPGERDSLGEPFIEGVAELRRLQVLDDSTDLAGIAGFDVEFADERVRVRTTNVADIVNVEMSALATITIDGAAIPIGSIIEDRLDSEELTDMRTSSTVETEEFELDLTAVESDGRWYFSLFHTVAELARADAGSEDIPDPGIVPDGADSPEGAVDRLLDRVGELDLGGLIAVLDPAEAAALQRYAPLFVDDAQSALDELPLTWRVDLREFRAEGSGDERTVVFDALGITGALDGVPFSVVFDDGCAQLDVDGEMIQQCGTDPADELEDFLADDPVLDEFVTVVTDAFADIEPIGLELRRRDGAWFISPFATGTEAVLTVMRALDSSEIGAIVDAGRDLASEASEVVLDVLDAGLDAGTDPLDDDLFDDGSLDDLFDDDQIDDDLFDSDESFPGQAVDQCYSMDDPDAAQDCFERAVDSGEIDSSFVPVVLLHPECGIAEYSWRGTWYELSDDEFTAIVTSAGRCFGDLVAVGELEPWTVPFEVVYLDCFEGRNWFAAFEDDYNERVNACIDAFPIDE